MLTVDMALYRDIDDYLCTPEQEADGLCDHGDIYTFPAPSDRSPALPTAPSSDDIPATPSLSYDDRIDCYPNGYLDPVTGRRRALARCFDIRPGSGTIVDNFHDDSFVQTWVDLFSDVYSTVINHIENPSDLVEAQSTTVSLRVGELCNEYCADPDPAARSGEWECSACVSGWCGKRRNAPEPFCQRAP